MVHGTLTARREQYEQATFALPLVGRHAPPQARRPAPRDIRGAGLRSHTARVRVAPCSTNERALVLQREETDTEELSQR